MKLLLKGDELARYIYEFTGRILGLALANAVMFSSPEAIILIWRTDQSR